MTIPNNLVSKFEILSRSNSENRIKTGGILGGIQEDDVFKITHLLVPEQNGSHDCWEVNSLRQISNFFDYNNHVMLGLIHTHPAMSSFLSSVDLHALWNYARNNKSLISIYSLHQKNKQPQPFVLLMLALKRS